MRSLRMCEVADQVIVERVHVSHQHGTAWLGIEIEITACTVIRMVIHNPVLKIRSEYLIALHITNVVALVVQAIIRRYRTDCVGHAFCARGPWLFWRLR